MEAIFAKAKPKTEKLSVKISHHKSKFDESAEFNDEEEDEEVIIPDNNISEEDDDAFDEDKLTEESYRTTFDTNPADLELEAEDVADDEY